MFQWSIGTFLSLSIVNSQVDVPLGPFFLLLCNDTAVFRELIFRMGDQHDSNAKTWTYRALSELETTHLTTKLSCHGLSGSSQGHRIYSETFTYTFTCFLMLKVEKISVLQSEKASAGMDFAAKLRVHP